MNKSRSNRPSSILLLLSAAFLLRAVIPVGYMPAAAGSGLMFELCPAGVSTEFAQFLASHSGQGHQHAHHGSTEEDNHQCEVGHMLLSAAAVDDIWQLDVATAALSLRSYSTNSFASASRYHYHSRDPPV